MTEIKRYRGIRSGTSVNKKYSIEDACMQQPRTIVFDTMRYRRSETVQRSGDLQSSPSFGNV